MSLFPALRLKGAALLVALSLFCSGMWLYTAHNNFPFYYHPDEKGKITQIAEHERNSHHPLMMLTVTAVVTAFHQGSLTFQEIVQKGRSVSAFFSSVAVVAMALLARRMAGSTPLAGLLAGFSAGVLLLCDALMFDLAHLMKEDPALAMGLALTFLALHIFWQRRDEQSLMLTAIAAATAVSGKYIGWLLFPFVFWIVNAGVDPSERKRYRRLFLKSFLIAFAVLNYSLVFNPFKPFRSLGNEMEGVILGHRGMTRSVPHADYFRLLLEIPPFTLALFGVYLAGLAVRFRKVTPPEWLVPGFGALLLAIMSFSPKSSARYFLPVEMVVCFGAGLGLVWLVSALADRCGGLRLAVLTAGWALLLAPTVRQAGVVLEQHYRALLIDDRVTLRNWLIQNLPASTIIAEDNRVHLFEETQKNDPESKLPFLVLHGSSAGDLGNLKQLRSRGVTHVAVIRSAYGMFDKHKPREKIRDKFERRKAFYASLGVLPGSEPEPGVRQVWKTPAGINSYLQPGITLFDITGVESL